MKSTANVDSKRFMRTPTREKIRGTLTVFDDAPVCVEDIGKEEVLEGLVGFV